MIEFNPSPTELLFWDALALIAAACLFAPIFHRLGLGTILGYLTAGLAVQLVFGEALAEHPEDLLHIAEFGVVLFLFVIGLELKPSTLWSMRGDIFGLGLAQMAACGAILAVAAASIIPLSPPAAIVVGLGLALSSTALVMQMLEERRERTTLHGRKSFAILLFQDLAIVPLLLLVSLLSPEGEGFTLLTALKNILIAVTALGLLVLIARYLLDPMFFLMARTNMPEIMTASALGVVLGAALLINLVGMSYAMGAFIAGVLLAESAYRHEVEADIEPFRGLFLGLFFLAIGLALDLEAVVANWAIILAAAPAAMVLKGVTIYGVMRSFRIDHAASVRTAIALPQHGEFSFVLFAAMVSAGVLDSATSSMLIAIATVSMAISTIVVRLEHFFVAPAEKEEMQESYEDVRGRTLIIGFGRFGQVVSQLLFARGIDVTILDSDADRIRDARRFGFHLHFGNGTRRDVLRAAGAGRADMIVVCTDDPEITDEIALLVRSAFPQAKLYVRAYDRGHVLRLIKTIKVDDYVRETFESALRMGHKVLTGLGVSEEEAARIEEDVRQRDRDRLREQLKGDIRSGSDRLHVAPVKPEPLVDRD